jgi:hypothetical protein
MRRSDIEKRVMVTGHPFTKEIRSRMDDPHLELMFNNDTHLYELWSNEGGLHYIMTIKTPKGHFREPSEKDIFELQRLAWNKRQDIIKELEEHDRELRKKKEKERASVRHDLVKDYHEVLSVAMSGEDNIHRNSVLVNADISPKKE